MRRLVPVKDRCVRHRTLGVVVANESRVCCSGDDPALFCGACRVAYVADAPPGFLDSLAARDLGLRIRVATALDYPETDRIRLAVARAVPSPPSTAEVTRLLVASRSAARTPHGMPRPRTAAVHEDIVGTGARHAESVAAPPAPATAVLAERIRTERAASHRR